MAYITTSKLASYLEANESDHTATLVHMCSAASEAVDDYCHRNIQGSVRGAGFLTHSVVSERDYLDWDQAVVLGEWPIVSLTSITLHGTELASSDYYLEPDVGIVRFIDGSGYPLSRSGPLITSYVAGYAAVPTAAKEACYRLCSFWFARKGLEGVGASLISDLQETFRIPEAQRILEDSLSHLVLDAS